MTAAKEWLIVTNTGKFWQDKHLLEMTHDEWESVCDGCAKCCLHQLEDEQSGMLVFTNVACDLLDENTCRCSDYDNRSVRQPNCMTMDKSNLYDCAAITPPSCAYRLLLEGKDLPPWHHLISDDPKLIHKLGKSSLGKVIKSKDIDGRPLEEYAVEWPELK